MNHPNHSPVPSEPGGIYFIVPYPEGWEVCAFPFKLYPDAGHALIWEQVVAPQLALRWSRRLHSAADLDRQPQLIVLLKRRLASLYDGVPRGRAQAPLDQPNRCTVHHGNDLTPDMGITRRQIQARLLLPAGVCWQHDSHETCNLDSARRLRLVLGLSPG